MQRANLDLPVCNFIYGTKLNGEEFPVIIKVGKAARIRAPVKRGIEDYSRIIFFISQ